MAHPLPPIIEAERAASIGDVVWCDVRWYLDGADGHEAYVAEHIHGAIFIDLDRHLAAAPSPTQGRHPMPTAAAFARSLGELGIARDDPVVAYDDCQGVPAGRFVWMLRALGHDAALLDGGLDHWRGPRARGEEVRDPVEYPTTEWPDLFVDADTTASLASSTNAIVVDARTPERFRGDIEPIDARAGHIPGAINVPYAGNLDSDGRFLPKPKLRERFAAAGIDDTVTGEVVNYCGSGVSACHNMLAMEHVGISPPAAKLYPGSWSAWSGDRARRVATGS